MKALAIGLLVALAAGCPGYDPCLRRCIADPPPCDCPGARCSPPTTRREDAGASKCGAEGESFAYCLNTRPVCDADNHTDGPKTLAACSAEYDAYTKCLTAP